jgi:hypothetical protein
MALLSLTAAILAFWGPRLKSYQLAGLRKPGVAGAFLYSFIFSLGTSAAPLLCSSHGRGLLCRDCVWGDPRVREKRRPLDQTLLKILRPI